MRQDPGLDTGSAGSAGVHVTARGPEEKGHRQGQKQSGEEQGSRGTETIGWDLSVGAPITQRWAALGRQLIFALMILFRGKLSGLIELTPLWAAGQLQRHQAWEGGQGPLCPCPLKCTAQAM